MRNIRRKFKNPKSPWDVQRIAAEKKLTATYGLRRKKEIRNAEALLRNFRKRARELIAAENKEKEQKLLEKLQKMGILAGGTLDDVLALTVENILNRRLQTIIHNKGKALSVKHARQVIVHEQVMIGDRIIKYPSYLVSTDEENAIRVMQEYEKKKPGVGQVVQARGTSKETATEKADGVEETVEVKKTEEKDSTEEEREKRTSTEKADGEEPTKEESATKNKGSKK